MKRVTFIVQSPMNIEQPWGIPLSAEWVKARLDLYHKFTLPSLLNQSFADFRIFAYCGEASRAVNESYPWHPRVEQCYDFGKSRIEEIDTDFLSITRIDSDDLMHREAMAEVRDNVGFVDGRESMVFTKCFTWDTINNSIRGYPHMGEHPPFFTHVFPRSIYSDWEKFCKLHHLPFSKATPDAKKLSARKICMLRHWNNISIRKKNRKPKILTEEQRGKLIERERYGFVIDRNKIIKILKDFSVKEEDIK